MKIKADCCVIFLVSVRLKALGYNYILSVFSCLIWKRKGILVEDCDEKWIYHVNLKWKLWLNPGWWSLFHPEENLLEIKKQEKSSCLMRFKTKYCWKLGKLLLSDTTVNDWLVWGTLWNRKDLFLCKEIDQNHFVAWHLLSSCWKWDTLNNHKTRVGISSTFSIFSKTVNFRFHLICSSNKIKISPHILKEYI